MIYLSGIEIHLQAISNAINHIAFDKTHWITDAVSLIAVIVAAKSAQYSKEATEAVKDTQQDVFRPILQPVDLKDHLAEHFYTLTLKNDGRGPLHDLQLETSPELIAKSLAVKGTLAVGEEESFKIDGSAYDSIFKNKHAKFTYTDIYHRMFSTTIWFERITYGEDFIKDWKTELSGARGSPMRKLLTYWCRSKRSAEIAAKERKDDYSS